MYRLAFGTTNGLAIVDYLQKTCLLNMGTPDLYGSADPYQRTPRSPRKNKMADIVEQLVNDSIHTPGEQVWCFEYSYAFYTSV